MSPNLVGVVPLWLVFDIEDERVRNEEFQTGLMTKGNGRAWERR